MSEDLNKAVVAVVRECLGVRPNEEVLVVCNPATYSMGEAMRAEAEAVGAEAVLAVISERDSHAGEPPATVAEGIVAALEGERFEHYLPDTSSIAEFKTASIDDYLAGSVAFADSAEAEHRAAD